MRNEDDWQSMNVPSRSYECDRERDGKNGELMSFKGSETLQLIAEVLDMRFSDVAQGEVLILA